MTRLEIRFTMQFRTAVHTTGDRALLYADKAMAMGSQSGERPIIPASSVKGLLRAHAEAVLRSRGLGVCDPTQSGVPHAGCPICRVFGSSRRRGSLRFRDAEPAEDVVALAYRTGVSLSRHRRSAFKDLLYTTETAWRGPFVTKMDGFFADKADALVAAAVVFVGVRAAPAVGGMRSRGLGWLETVDCEVRLDGRRIDDAELGEAVRELLAEGGCQG